MRTVVQRVARASVTVDGNVVGEIERGLLVLLGVGHDDTDTQRARWPRRSRRCASSRTTRER